MKKYWIFLFILLVPDTLFCADYFLASNCIGLTDVRGDIKEERLTSCINQLIDGINKTRQIMDSKINNRNSTVKSTDRNITGLKKESGARSKNDSDLKIDAASEHARNVSEQHEDERDLKIKQLEARISILEKSLIELQSAKPDTK